MASSHFAHPSPPSCEACADAHAILCNANDSARSFLATFDTVRKTRNAKGTPTDEEQDLLRAMVLFASAGLDSMVKQLIRDGLPAIVERDEGATLRFKDFIEKRLRDGEGGSRRFLADILGDQNPRKRLLLELVSDLTSNSLQSAEELLKVASYFNIPSERITKDIAQLKNIFLIRNQIGHEMDIDFSQTNRSRRPRARDKMIEYATELLRIAAAFLAEVDAKQAAASSSVTQR
jgi:hypothetical protein